MVISGFDERINSKRNESMVQKRDISKALIAESFKELMLKNPFEKITIKMITEKAGLIRPTFYNHFKDKYDLVEWIFYEEIIKEVSNLIDHGMEKEAVKYLITCIYEERGFYKKAFEITGQNCFEHIMIKHIYEICLKRVKESNGMQFAEDSILNEETVSQYYALDLVTAIKTWVIYGIEDMTVNQIIDAYHYLMTHSIYDIIQ